PDGSTTVEGAPGVEMFMYVIEGEFRFDFGAPEPVVLEAGDGAVFRSPGRYTVRNIAPTEGQVLAVGVPVDAFTSSDGARAAATPRRAAARRVNGAPRAARSRGSAPSR